MRKSALAPASSFGINLNASVYTSGSANKFRANEINRKIGSQCTTFAFGRALELGLYSFNKPLGHLEK